MATYTVQLDREHATTPTVCWIVEVWDLVNGGLGDDSGHRLVVPHLESWMPDTLRLVLYELAAYIPAHEPDTAVVRIDAKLMKPRGRAPKVPRRPGFDHDVRISVEACGWRAEVLTSHDFRKPEDGKFPPHPGWFTEPMQTFLLDLAARSPFQLSSVRPEYSGDGEDRGDLMPSRACIQRGREALWDPEQKDWRHDLREEHVRRLENIRPAPRRGRRLPDIKATSRDVFEITREDED